MIYPLYKTKSQSQNKTLTLSEFDRGINDECGEFSSDGTVLNGCVNMQHKNGALKTRAGIRAISDSLTEAGEYDDRVYFPFTVTEVTYNISGKPYNLAYCCTGYADDAQFNVFLVDTQGNITSASGINFHRIDYLTFNIPKSVFFIVSKKISGNGVFLFVKRASSGVAVYEVYEAQSGFSGWTNVSDSVYVPTVRINGRGTRYEEAASLSGLNYPQVERPEQLNALNGTFICYYTSDGLSSIFRLPYGNLHQYSSFTCRIYTDVNEYVQWQISFDDTSDTQTIGGQQVTMYLNRTLGVVSFRCGNNNYSVPLMQNCKLNNIMFKATSSDNDFAGEIVSSKGAVTLNNRVYIYGNDINPNCIYCAKMENPLYFPVDSKLFLGDSTSPVTALKVQNGKLIAFKPNETYRIITDFGGTSSEKEAVLPERTLYIKGDTLSAQTIDANIGCVNPATIRLCGSRLVWLATDGSIYALATTTYGNTTNIYRVSQPLGDRLKLQSNLSGAFAVTKDGEYILINGKTAFVMNYRVRGFGYSRTYYSADDKLVSPAWFEWRLPESSSYISAALVDLNPVIVSSFGDGLTFYLNTIGGADDTVLGTVSGESAVITRPIKSGFTTKVLDLGSDTALKSVDKVFINGNSEYPAKLTVSDGGRKVIRQVKFNEYKNSFFAGAVMPVCKDVSVGVSCEKPFSVRNIVLKYRIIGDKG